MHIIPHRFIRIRHYGFLANRNKKTQLEVARKSLKVLAPSPLPIPDAKWFGTFPNYFGQYIL